MIPRLTPIFLAGVIAVAVIGYFVGIHDGVPKPDGLHRTALVTEYDQHEIDANPKLIPAVTYAQIGTTAMGPTPKFQQELKPLPGTGQSTDQPYELFAEIKPSEVEKEASSKLRASRRAFNGAPPIIPHAVQDTTDAACYACHSAGMKLAGLKASVMSHPFLANCTQCHAPPPPAPFADADVSVASTFVGLPAPSAGARAFAGAPPTIPHSQWMRENCIACHGGPHGWAGMESTHPWRTNCTQCHAPSAVLDQAIAADHVPMLPPLEIAGD